jgi:GntR family transcriptional regulator/MocR family aminotransferase
MALWCRVAEGVDVERWAAAAAAAAVPFDSAARFTFDGAPRQALRLGFAAEAERELREGVRRIAAALPHGPPTARRPRRRSPG